MIKKLAIRFQASSRLIKTFTSDNSAARKCDNIQSFSFIANRL